MNLAGLSTAAKILLIAGLLLFIDLFLAWQQACAGAGGFNVCGSLSGWDGIGILTGLLVLALLLWEGAQLAGVTASLNVPVALVSAGLAGGVTLITVIEFFSHSTARHWPAWVGLVLAIVIGYGGWLRLKAGPETAMMGRGGHNPPSPPPAV
jgi:hypothetical protein